MREWLRHSPDAKHYRVRLAKAVLIELHERVWPSASVQSGRTRFPGITADARRLGVNRATLFKMLAGYPGFAGLKSLRARYRALRKEVA